MAGISFDWEEMVFLGFRKLGRGLKALAQKDAGEHIATLEPLNHRLTLLAQIVTGAPVRILAAEDAGGVGPDLIRLPGQIDLFPNLDQNIGAYVLRTVISAQIICQGIPCMDNAAIVRKLSALFAAKRAVDSLCREWPCFQDAYEKAAKQQLETRPRTEKFSARAAHFELLRRSLLCGETRDFNLEKEALVGWKNAIDLGPELVLWGETFYLPETVSADHNGDQSQLPGDGQEIKGKAVDTLQRLELPDMDEVDPIPIHTFEKAETLDEYKGGQREADGSDELQDHAEAIEELDLREVIRGGKRSEGFIKVDMDMDGGVADLGDIDDQQPGIPYPEWHYKKGIYRENWTKVFPTSVTGGSTAFVEQILKKNRNLIERLYGELLRFRTRNLRLRAQADGNDIDLDAVIRARCDRAAGITPKENLYEQVRKYSNDSATTILMDVSLSSGSWVEGKRVLDVTRESMVVIGEVAERLGDQFRLMAFAANTRHCCRIFDIKQWNQPWSRAGAGIFALEPRGYTRIGPALRHATADLDKKSARHKLLILITDGKPTDYDRYEGRYGRADIKQAVREASQKGIHTFVLALDPSARLHLPEMFGRSGVRLVSHLNHLPEIMVEAYGRFVS